MSQLHRLAQDLRRIVAAGTPGAFVHIDEGDATRFLTAGTADLASGRLMAPDMRYRIGSTTKTFTAVVVLQLVGEQRFALQDRVTELLPDFDIPSGEALTVQHLLGMRSGLRDFVDAPELLTLDANLSPHTLAETLRLGLEHEPNFAPGGRFQYCNTNFCLLEAVVQRVTGRSLQAELTDRVFLPLAMHHTSYPPEDDLALPEPYIRGYDWTQAGWRECSRVFFGRGDGAIISTALDIARFLRGLIGGLLLPSSLLEAMCSIPKEDPPAQYAYGLGLMADRLVSRSVWGHSGGGFGYRHWPFIDPGTGRVVICMLNGTYGFRVSSRQESQQPRFTREFRELAFRGTGQR